MILLKSILIINRFISKFKVTSLRKCGTASINRQSLNLTPFNVDCIELNIENNIYKFNIRNIIKIYKNNLYNVDEFYYLSGGLASIRNPYTNIPLTIRNHVILFEHIKRFYFKINKFPPQYLINFKRCYFNINIYIKTYNSSLLFHSIGSYLCNLSNNELKNELLCLINSSEFIQRRYCSKCFKKNNIEKDFIDAIRVFILNSNMIFNYGDYEEKFILICKDQGIKLDLNHSKHHRRLFKVRRRINPLHHSPSITTHPFVI